MRSDESQETAAVHAWAERLAASLPPLSAGDAVRVGRIAAAIDARRHQMNRVGRPEPAQGGATDATSEAA